MARLFNPDIATLGTDPANQQLVQQGLAQLQDRYDKAKELEFNARLQAGESFLNADDLERFNQDVDNKIKESYKNFDGKIGFGANQLKQSALNIMQHPAKKLADKQKRYYEDVLKHEAAGHIVLNKKDILAPIFDQEGKVRDIGELQVLNPDELVKTSQIMGKTMLESMPIKARNMGNGYLSMYKLDEGTRQNILNTQGNDLAQQAIASLGVDLNNLTTSQREQVLSKAKIGLSAGLMDEEKIMRDEMGMENLKYRNDLSLLNEKEKRNAEKETRNNPPYIVGSNWKPETNKLYSQKDIIASDYDKAKISLDKSDTPSDIKTLINYNMKSAKQIAADKLKISVEDLEKQTTTQPIVTSNDKLNEILKKHPNFELSDRQEYVSNEPTPTTLPPMMEDFGFLKGLGIATIGAGVAVAYSTARGTELLARKVMAGGEYVYENPGLQAAVDAGLIKESSKNIYGTSGLKYPMASLVPTDKLSQQDFKTLVDGLTTNKKINDNMYSKELKSAYTSLVENVNKESYKYVPSVKGSEDLVKLKEHIKLNATHIASAAPEDDREDIVEVFKDLENIEIDYPSFGKDMTIYGKNKDGKEATLTLDPSKAAGRNRIKSIALFTKDADLYNNAMFNYAMIPESGVSIEDITKREGRTIKGSGIKLHQDGDVYYFTKSDGTPVTNVNGDITTTTDRSSAVSTLKAMEGVPTFEEEILANEIQSGSQTGGELEAKYRSLRALQNSNNQWYNYTHSK